MRLTAFQCRPAIDAAISHPNNTLYQLQPSFHSQSTEPEPTARSRVNPALNAPYDDIDLQHAIAQEHWYVCGYKMNMK